MKKIVLVLFMLVVCGFVSADDYSCSSHDSALVVKLLKKAKNQPSNTNYMIFFARQLIGIPYVAHTLDISKRERLIINLHQLDCYTYVEAVSAFSICAKNHKYDFQSYVNTVKKLRYRGGKIEDYSSRLHYFTDWIIDNTLKGEVHEIQSPDPPFMATQIINVGFMSDNYQKYSMLKANPRLVPKIKIVEHSLNGRRYKYIPKYMVRNNIIMRKAVKDGDIIAIITNKKGLDTSHVGIAVWHNDGLHLLNASQLHHRVVEEDMTFANYLSQHPVQTGIRVIILVK